MTKSHKNKSAKKDAIKTEMKMEHGNGELAMVDKLNIKKENVYFSLEETNKLIDTLQICLLKPNKNDTYSQQIKTINWDVIASNIPERNPAECRVALDSFLNSWNCIKSLQQILSEGKEILQSDGEAFEKIDFKMVEAINRFHEDNPDIPEENLYDEFNKVSKKQKAKYLPVKPLKKDEPKPYLLPIYVLRDKMAKKNELTEHHPLKIMTEVSKRYLQLTDKERFKCIKKSIESFNSYLEEIEDFKTKYPEWQPPPFRYAAKQQLKQYFIEELDMPDKPTTCPINYYADAVGIKESVGNESKGPACLLFYNKKRTQFHALPAEEQAQWKEKMQKNLERFETKFAVWLSKQCPAVKNIIQNVNLFQSSEKQKKKKITWIEEMTELKNSSFDDQPQCPVISPLKLFVAKACKHLDEKEKKQFYEDRHKHWKEADDKKKKVAIEKSKKNKEIYAGKLMEYVQTLPTTMVRIFLGFRRKKFYSMFQRDIFEEHYPNQDYPILVKGDKKKPLKSTDGSDSEDDTAEQRIKEEFEDAYASTSSQSEDEEDIPIKKSIANSTPNSKTKRKSESETEKSPKKLKKSNSQSEIVSPKKKKKISKDVTPKNKKETKPEWENDSDDFIPPSVIQNKRSPKVIEAKNSKKGKKNISKTKKEESDSGAESASDDDSPSVNIKSKGSAKKKRNSEVTSPAPLSPKKKEKNNNKKEERNSILSPTNKKSLRNKEKSSLMKKETITPKKKEPVRTDDSDSDDSEQSFIHVQPSFMTQSPANAKAALTNDSSSDSSDSSD